MLLSKPFSLIKFYLKSQQMSDSFDHITESDKLNEKKKKVQNILIRPCFGILAKDDGHDVKKCTVQSMTS